MTKNDKDNKVTPLTEVVEDEYIDPREEIREEIRKEYRKKGRNKLIKDVAICTIGGAITYYLGSKALDKIEKIDTIEISGSNRLLGEGSIKIESKK